MPALPGNLFGKGGLEMNSNVGLAIQCVGIFLVTLLSFFMRGSIRSASLKYWTIAWTCLSISLCSLFAGFHVSAAQKPYYSLYFFGEYAFGLMFLAGCRYYSTGARVDRRHFCLLIPATMIAVVLPYLSPDFNDLFMVQAIIMSSFFAVSFLALRPALRRKDSPGLRVITVALVLLAIDFLHYVPVFGARKGAWGITVPASYLQYTSIFDLILEILLGFGTMMVLMEGVRREVEAANQKLTDAHDQLELIAQMDPLTEALNRHAFHSLLNRNESGAESDTSGSVVVIDIDNLKPINDSMGHSIGDKAIRAVARATRSLIRADDMLFRWGGDEFLVLMFKLPDAEASRRMQSLNDILKDSAAKWTAAPVTVSVTFGVAGFDSMTQIGLAIEQADKAMYERRQQLRKAEEEMQVSSHRLVAQ
jgi:diguanylate cyclase (GGDEF)-like protein